MSMSGNQAVISNGFNLQREEKKKVEVTGPDWMYGFEDTGVLLMIMR